MTTRELAIEAYRSILKGQEPMRRFADFRYLFYDEKDTSVPVPLGGRDLQGQNERIVPGYIHEYIPERHGISYSGIGCIFGHRDSEGSWSGPDHRL